MSQNWHTQRTAEIASMQHKLYAKTDAGHKFQINEDVQLTGKLVNGTQVLPPYILGRITGVGQDELVVEFDDYGKVALSHAIASDYLQPYRSKNATDAVRAVFGKGPRAMQELKIGSKVRDGQGVEYVVERVDPVRRMAVITDSEGRVTSRGAGELKLIVEAGDPGKGERQTVGSDGVQPGTRATVTGIDPNFNQWRKYAVQQGEGPGIIGQTGTIISAMYPTGAGKDNQGETMYTVLLPSGAKKSFSAKELHISESGAEARSLTEARDPVARRSLQPASTHRPTIELTEDMLAALEESTAYTRQHYEMLGDMLHKAKATANLSPEEHDALVHRFTRVFSADNPNFIQHRFIARAGGAEYEGPRSRNAARPTRRHFKMAADVIRDAPLSPQARAGVISSFMDDFSDANPRFNSGLFHKAAGGFVPAPHEQIGDVSGNRPKIGIAHGEPGHDKLGEAAVGGMAQGSIVKQPKPVTDAPPKAVPAAKAAVPPKMPTMPKLGSTIKTPKGSGVVTGEVDGQLQVALDSGEFLLIDESVLGMLPGYGRTHWIPPDVPQDKDTPPIKLGDLIDYNGVPGVVAEITAEGARVMLDNGKEGLIEAIPGMPSPSAAGASTPMPKPISAAKPPTTSSMPSTTAATSTVATEAKDKDKDGEDDDDDDDDDNDKKKKKGKDKDDDDKDEKDDKKVDEGMLGMRPMPSFKTSAPSSSRVAAEGAPVEGGTLIIDGKEAQILGFTRFDNRTLLPTEARVSVGGEEQLIALAGQKSIEERAKDPIRSGIQRTLQRLNKERPKPVTEGKEETLPADPHQKPAFTRSLVESIRLGKGLGSGGGAGIAPSSQTLQLEQQIAAHSAGTA